MISGCVSGSHYKIGSGFDFVSRWQSTGAQVGTISVCVGYCGELSAYCGDGYSNGYLYSYTTAGGVRNVDDSSSLIVKAGIMQGASNVTITPCQFCEVSAMSVGNGSLSVGGTAYGGKYRTLNASVPITTTPASGYRLRKLTINGSDVTANPPTAIDADWNVVAYFVPTNYQVTCNSPSGGSVSFTKNGVPASVPFSANVDDVIACTCTPDSAHAVQNFVVDGQIAGGGSYAAQTFSFTIYEREDDPTYNCTVSFSERTAIVDAAIGDGVVVKRGEEEVDIGADGTFNAYVGNSYTATAQAPDSFHSFDGWFNANGELVAQGNSYSWLQGNSAVVITARYTPLSLFTASLYVGTSTSDYGTESGTAYEAGCRAVFTEHPIMSGGKYIAGRFTVNTTLPSGENQWTFSGVYVRDDDKKGGTKFIKANGSMSVTFYSESNASFFAIFANGEEVLPQDVDQGHSVVASGTAANGLYEWEANEGSPMLMRWRSKRYVSDRPINLSTARVYADGYTNGEGGNDVALIVATFQSPDNADGKETNVIAKSQNAFRLPMRRPEKYVELEVSSHHQITQVAVSTGMEALWQ